MKQQVVRVLDCLLPSSIKDHATSEELDRARALVFLELLVLVCALLALTISTIFFLLTSSTSVFLSQSIHTLAICLPSYIAALFIFARTGNHLISGNLFAFGFYTTVIAITWTLEEQKSIGCILYLLALPLLVTFIADYTSGIVWVVLVALAPLMISAFGHANFDPLFLGNWTALCFGLFTVIRLSHNYLKRMSRRLKVQCTSLEFAAGHDALTGIANRATFDQHLNESIEHCQQHGTQLALIYIDLDGFKPINDAHGHHVGDIVLSTVADRLRHLVRRTDIVARLGGDEFAIIFSQSNPASIEAVLDRINHLIGEPVAVANKHLQVGCSLGVALCPNDGFSAMELLRLADERMYAAKRQAKTDSQRRHQL